MFEKGGTKIEAIRHIYRRLGGKRRHHKRSRSSASSRTLSPGAASADPTSLSPEPFFDCLTEHAASGTTNVEKNGHVLANNDGVRSSSPSSSSTAAGGGGVGCFELLLASALDTPQSSSEATDAEASAAQAITQTESDQKPTSNTECEPSGDKNTAHALTVLADPEGEKNHDDVDIKSIKEIDQFTPPLSANDDDDTQKPQSERQSPSQNEQFPPLPTPDSELLKEEEQFRNEQKGFQKRLSSPATDKNDSNGSRRSSNDTLKDEQTLTDQASTITNNANVSLSNATTPMSSRRSSIVEETASRYLSKQSLVEPPKYNQANSLFSSFLFCFCLFFFLKIDFNQIIPRQNLLTLVIICCSRHFGVTTAVELHRSHRQLRQRQHFFSIDSTAIAQQNLKQCQFEAN